MTTLVLCDGSEGSLRSIEVACAGGGPTLANARAEHTLVLAHVWDAPAPRSAAAETHNTRASVSSAAMSCADVLTTTLRYVHTNKYLKNRLHYTVETACAASVAQPEAGGGACGGADAAGAGESTAQAGPAVAGKAAAATAAQKLSTSGGPGAASGRRRSELQRPPPGGKAAVDSARTDAAAAAGGTAGSAGSDGPGLSESEKRAMAVVRYVSARAAHHRAAALLLGVGQRQEGKVCTVGSVAQGVLRELRQVYPLFYVKKDGVKWRPALATAAAGPASSALAAPSAAAALRFSVVVAVPTDAPWETAAGSPKAAGANPSTAATAVQPPKVVQAAIASAVQFVQAHCMRPHTGASKDQINFTVVATSSTQQGEADAADAAAPPSGAADQDGADAVEPPPVQVNPLDAYRTYLESLPVFHQHSFIASADAAPHHAVVPQPPPQQQQQPAAEAEATMEDGGVVQVHSLHKVEAGPAGDVEGDASAADTTVTAAPSPPLPPTRVVPPVTVCVLKASKKHPLITLDATPDVALPQLVKQITSGKPDVLVMPASLVPERVQLGLLAAGNPHCIVLPF